MTRLTPHSPMADIMRPERWIDRMADGTAVLLDPADGTELTGVHTWIAEDARLSEGDAFLGRVGAKTVVRLDGVVHFGIVGFAPDFARAAGAGAFLGFEDFAWNRHEHAAAVREAQLTGAVSMRDPFKRYLYQRGAAHAPASFSFDVEATSEPLDRVAWELAMVVTDDERQLPETRGLRRMERSRLYLAFQALRHAYWPGKLGYELSRAGHDSDSPGYLIAGGAHLTLFKRQLEELYGMHVHPRQVPSPILSPHIVEAQDRLMAELVQNRRATPYQLFELDG